MFCQKPLTYFEMLFECLARLLSEAAVRRYSSAALSILLYCMVQLCESWIHPSRQIIVGVVPVRVELDDFDLFFSLPASLSVSRKRSDNEYVVDMNHVKAENSQRDVQAIQADVVSQMWLAASKF